MSDESQAGSALATPPPSKPGKHLDKDESRSEIVMAHLQMIQDVINRMAANSFLLKGWSVTISAALFALAAKESNVSFALLALAPVLIFWLLDAYYLRLERLFRALFDDTRHLLTNNEPLKHPFTMDIRPFEKKTPGVLRIAISLTVVALHGVLLGVILATYHYLRAPQ